MFSQYNIQRQPPVPVPVYRPAHQLGAISQQMQPPPVSEPVEPLSQSLEKSVGSVRRNEDEFSFLDFFTNASNIIPFMLFWAMTLLFYVSDMESWRMNYEEAPDEGTPVTKGGVDDDPSVSDKFVPGGRVDGLTPGIWGSYDKENDSEGDNKTIDIDSVTGKIRYSLGSFDTQMVWDWITGVAHKVVPKSDPKEKIRNKYTSLKLSKKESVQLLHDLGILKHSDLWELITTPCSTTKQNFVGSDDCLVTRRNLQIIAWRFFSSDTAPLIYPVRPIRIPLINENDKEFLKDSIDPKEKHYTVTRYYLGATGPIEAMSPFLIGTQIE